MEEWCCLLSWLCHARDALGRINQSEQAKRQQHIRRYTGNIKVFTAGFSQYYEKRKVPDFFLHSNEPCSRFVYFCFAASRANTFWGAVPWGVTRGKHYSALKIYKLASRYSNTSTAGWTFCLTHQSRPIRRVKHFSPALSSSSLAVTAQCPLRHTH